MLPQAAAVLAASNVTEASGTSIAVADSGGDVQREVAELWNAIAPPGCMRQALNALGPVPRGGDWSATRLLFLGTGSSEPSKYRGPSALWLQVRSMCLTHVVVAFTKPEMPM
jgi:hypothetical protein